VRPAVEDVLPTIRSRCRHLSCAPRRPRRSPRCWSAGTASTPPWRRSRPAPPRVTSAGPAARHRRGRPAAPARRPAPAAVLGELSGALQAAGDLVDAATAEANEQAATLATTEAEEMRRGLGVGPGGRQPAGAAAALKDLEKEQKARATRTKRDSIDRALVDLAGFYRDVLAVQADAAVELVNDEMRTP
jgi:DNA polymerase-3 subunit delta'